MEAQQIIYAQQITTKSVPLSKGSMYFSFVCDVSGSMAGSKIRAAEESFKDILDNVLQPEDFMEFRTFSDEVHNKHYQGRKKMAEWSRIKDKLVAGGSTKLYDAIWTAIDTTPRNKKYHDMQREMIVLTDGEDTSSSRSLEEVKRRVAKPQVPNFHLIVIGVGIQGAAKAALESICEPSHCTYLSCGDNAQELKKMFSRAKATIVERRESFMLCYTTSSSTTVGGRQHAPRLEMPPFNSMLLAMQPGAGNHHPSRVPRIAPEDRFTIPSREESEDGERGGHRLHVQVITGGSCQPASSSRPLVERDSRGQAQKPKQKQRTVQQQQKHAKQQPTKPQAPRQQKEAGSGDRGRGGGPKHVLWIGNIHTSVDKAKLLMLCSKFGECKVKQLGISQGQVFQNALVAYNNQGALDNAVRSIKGFKLEGIALEARKKQ